MSGDTFQAELVDVCKGVDHVVAIQHATAERDDLRLDVIGCQLIRVEDEQIIELRGHYSDQYALDEFWS